MEIKEAIERLELRKFTCSMDSSTDECRKENEAINMAIKALKAKMKDGE